MTKTEKRKPKIRYARHKIYRLLAMFDNEMTPEEADGVEDEIRWLIVEYPELERFR